MPRRVCVVAALRTPVGRHGGSLSTIRPDDLAAHVIRAVVDRTGIDPAIIDDVYLGATNQAGEDNRNVARMASLIAGLPVTVPGATVNRLCASGLEAIHIAARMIESGQGDVMIAGGVESMSRAPYVLSKSEQAFGRGQELVDSTIGWRFVNPRLAAAYPPISLGETAECVARQHGVSRADQDAFALSSQQKWAAAQAAGKFDAEIVPVEIPQGKKPPIRFTTDEHPRPDTTIEKLAALKPCFSKEADATVTAGNSSGINDGAAALLLMEVGRAAALGLKPLAFIGAGASAGVDPSVMGIGPVPAIQKLAARAGVDLKSVDLFEINEAFAAQSVACVRALGLDAARVNVNGGAIAIGHPLGCSGARITCTLIHEMVRRDAKRGMASLCIGVGQGLALLVERD
ncbi:MAG: thiolase family protein [Planctomycetota bacterium]|nr:thiolase family protein [Planctomycetota bacterium]